MKIGVISLGCAKNLVDTENLLGLLHANGQEIVTSYEEAEAVIIPPTVTEIADSAFDNSNLRYIYGIPGSAAELFAAAHPFLTFVPVDDAWIADR